jgi:hypothetical protein
MMLQIVFRGRVRWVHNSNMTVMDVVFWMLLWDPIVSHFHPLIIIRVLRLLLYFVFSQGCHKVFQFSLCVFLTERNFQVAYYRTMDHFLWNVTIVPFLIWKTLLHLDVVQVVNALGSNTFLSHLLRYLREQVDGII